MLAKCDANDGIHDGVIDDPLSCRFVRKLVLAPSGVEFYAGDSADDATDPHARDEREGIGASLGFGLRPASEGVGT